MLQALVTQLSRPGLSVSRREGGVAFFGVAKELYRLEQVTYVCVNLPIVAHSTHYTHCVYSDSAVSHHVSRQRIDVGFMKAASSRDTSSWEDQPPDGAPSSDDGVGPDDVLTLEFALPSRHGETAIFAVSKKSSGSEWQEQKRVLMQECRILANYFHGHILRINGHNSEDDIIMSARELDCLRWTAAGKTAWEASVILGITERTVRFHLNAAREKLKSATTAQAVAKAVANKLIDP
jgi:DNA-binding CsgD family transcriptional regulator